MSLFAPTTTGLATASVRARPSAFAGTFAALVFSATVVTACVALAVSAAKAPVSPKQAELYDVGVAFSNLTVYLAIFVIGQVMSLAVAQRGRESALLRAIGAEPKQIRRMVATEALWTSVLALPVGYGLGALLARVWFDGMAANGMVPDGMTLTVGLIPLFTTAGVLVVCSQLGGMIAAWRASRTRPSAALADSAVQGGGRAGRVRATAAVAFLVGAIGLSVAAGAGSVEDAASEIPVVLLAYLVAIGLAGPWIGRAATAVAAPLLRRYGGVAGELAIAGARARSRRLAAAITPIAMMTAFAVVQFVSLTGEMDWMAVFGTLLYAGFTGLVAANTLVMLTLERLREFSLLRTVGAEKRQVRAIVVAESAITALAGLGGGALAAIAVLAPLGQKVGTPLSGLPVWVWAAMLVSGTGLVLAAHCAPLARMLRVRPIDGVTRRST
ncbi:ABC transporter permease [Streptomyces boncukensis]|uniref:ABC transporter permease n=1 Tax=Streptomyces boncukensis TaxID=2711219 RepID=A0A6G4X5Z6_9ACTN|nr:ABC transporter permease [Streptomyces boncukensis]NGO72164.1 ABC transporter permease [Streptomyces boncukensis]